MFLCNDALDAVFKCIAVKFNIYVIIGYLQLHILADSKHFETMFQLIEHNLRICFAQVLRKNTEYLYIAIVFHNLLKCKAYQFWYKV